MRLFLFERCILGIETANFDPNARKFTKLEPNEIFNDFAISLEPFNEIDSNFFYLKGMDQKITPKPIGPDRTKIAEVGAE